MARHDAMIRFLSLVLAAGLFALAGCGSTGIGPVTTSGSARPSSSVAQNGPSKLADPHAGAATSGAPGQTGTWWAWPPGVTTCGTPALYRIDGGQPVRTGDCAGMLFATPARVEVRVGQEIDLHTTTDTPDGTGVATPFYSLPSSPNDAILRAVARNDNGATVRFMAVAPGDVVLVTTGLCFDPASGRQTQGPCPVVDVTVTP